MRRQRDISFFLQTLVQARGGGFYERQTNVEASRPFRKQMASGRTRTGLGTFCTFQEPDPEKDSKIFRKEAPIRRR